MDVYENSQMMGQLLMNVGNRQRKIVSLIAAILFLPVFLDSSGIHNDPWSLNNRALPVSVLIALLFPFAAFACKSAKSFKLMALFIICIFFPSITFGIFHSQYFFLTLIMTNLTPLLAGFTACFLIKRIEPHATPERFLLAGVYVVGIVTLLWVPYQVTNLVNLTRANGSVLDVFVIYQIYVYWPTVLALTFCASFLSSNPMLWVLRVFIFVGIIFTGAREPILFMFVCSGLLVLTSGSIKYFLIFSLLTILLFVVLAVFLFLFPETAIAIKFIMMWTGESSLDGGRIYTAGQFNLTEVNPFWGTGFSNYGLFGSTHNQYLENYYRGGIFGIVISLITIFFWVRSYGYCSKLVWSIFGALLIVTSDLNTPTRVPYSGAIIWALFFFLVEARRGMQERVPSRRSQLRQS